jgi:hypothetical protein
VGGSIKAAAGFGAPIRAGLGGALGARSFYLFLNGIISKDFYKAGQFTFLKSKVFFNRH